MVLRRPNFGRQPGAPDGDTPRWIRLDYFERNFLAFISDLDFKSIVGVFWVYG